MTLTQVTFNLYHNGTLDDSQVLSTSHYWLENMEVSLDDDYPDAAVSLPESEVEVHTAPFNIE
mgnify:FL=1